MRTLKLFILVLICVALPSWAAGGGEAPSSGGASSSLEDREYKEKSNKLLGLEAKLKDMNESLSVLVEKKRREKDPDKVREMMSELVRLSKDRNKVVVEYRELKKYLIYRFPNLGKDIQRRYGVHEEASPEQLEKARGLEELLSETKDLIDQKYAPIIGDLPDEEKNAAPKKESDQPLRLVK